ncbi:TPR domain protein [Kockovaella imperatae]|uniref:TPR domain protein n=1 Tax=Kockovaella imperatae TaxID=4999 RepID=A0A1Y1UP36_9TREE|nr:TPR domain protein [Kockovaella imperatae]ORX38875.1 TPR domain protein [Kockovaella imperatae]
MSSSPPPSEPYFDIGKFHREISTTSPEAQIWFDRALVWIHGFHGDEAAHCAENALLWDPTSAISLWAMLAALSPNYAKSWAVMGPMKNSTMEVWMKNKDEMLRLAENAPPVEAGLCKALIHRFPPDTPETEEDWDFAALNHAYAEAMGHVYDQFPDDLDVASLYADSLLCLSPWKLWDLGTGEPLPGSQAVRTKQVLDKAYATPEGKRHPGILHLYIHLMEMSGTPENAVPAGDKLHGLIPDASHLNHMPSHIYVLVGDYRRAISANSRALFDDELYVSKGKPSLWYNILRLHNMHSLVYAAMSSGNWEDARDNLKLVETDTVEDLARTMPNVLEGFLGTWAHVYVRFGRWDEILAKPLRDDPEFYSCSTSMHRYARGIALAAQNRVREADIELEEMKRTMAKIPKGRLMFPNEAIDVLQVGEAMLEGEIEYRRGNFQAAFEHLREAMKRYDGLVYGEPWSWMMPVRHAYAALQLQQGHIEEALKTYEDDLGYSSTLALAHQHPNNVWALHGYHECVTRLGLKKQAQMVYPHLRLALAVADVPITSSCFCRLNIQKANGTAANGVPNGCCQ